MRVAATTLAALLLLQACSPDQPGRPGAGEELAPQSSAAPTSSTDEIAESSRQDDPCRLGYRIRTRALVWAVPIGEPKPLVDQQTARLTIKVAAVEWLRSDVLIPPDDEVEVTVYLDQESSKGLDLTGSAAGYLWQFGERSEPALVSLRYDPYQRTEFELAGYSTDPLKEVPLAPQCEFDEKFATFASMTGRSADVELLVDVAREQERVEVCQINQERDCSSRLLDALDAVDNDAMASAEDVNAAWWSSDPTVRSLTFASVPAEVAARLVLSGVHVRYESPLDDVVFLLRCSLGVGYAWTYAGTAPVLPVASCRGEETQVVVDDGLRQVVIGTIPSSLFERPSGVEVTISGESGNLKAVSAPLADGMIEKLTGLDAVSVDELRRQYSTPSTAVAESS
jgi:hypothetical protein